MLREERMSDSFTKYHIDGLPFDVVIHHFTAPDGLEAHDHPWGFTTHILSGGYVEQVFFVEDNGSWFSRRVSRRPGTSHHVSADRIHRIAALLSGDCWTLVLPEPASRETHFWTFEEGKFARSRPWNGRYED